MNYIHPYDLTTSRMQETTQRPSGHGSVLQRIAENAECLFCTIFHLSHCLSFNLSCLLVRKAITALSAAMRPSNTTAVEVSWARQLSVHPSTSYCTFSMEGTPSEKANSGQMPSTSRTVTDQEPTNNPNTTVELFAAPIQPQSQPATNQALRGEGQKRDVSADDSYRVISASEAHDPESWEGQEADFDEAKRTEWEKDDEDYDGAKQQTRVKSGAYEQFTSPDAQEIERRGKAEKERADAVERKKAWEDDVKEFGFFKFVRDSKEPGSAGDDEDPEPEWEDVEHAEGLASKKQ